MGAGRTTGIKQALAEQRRRMKWCGSGERYQKKKD